MVSTTRPHKAVLTDVGWGEDVMHLQLDEIIDNEWIVPYHWVG